MLIGISGKARSGKDTFAKILADELNKNGFGEFTLMAYANSLKMKVQESFDLTYDQLWGDAKEVEDVRYKKEDGSYWTAREILQAYGQFHRTIDANFWVKELFRIIDINEYENVIITDLRHVDEADAVVDRDGIHIRIYRDNSDEIHGSQHISETALDNYDKIDFIVINNYDLSELRKCAAVTVENLKLKENSEDG